MAISEREIKKLREDLALSQAPAENQRHVVRALEAENQRLRQENLRLQHELEVRTAQDGDTIRELRSQIRDLERQWDGGQGGQGGVRT